MAKTGRRNIDPPTHRSNEPGKVFRRTPPVRAPGPWDTQKKEMVVKTGCHFLAPPPLFSFSGTERSGLCPNTDEFWLRTAYPTKSAPSRLLTEPRERYQRKRLKHRHHFLVDDRACDPESGSAAELYSELVGTPWPPRFATSHAHPSRESVSPSASATVSARTPGCGRSPARGQS